MHFPFQTPFPLLYGLQDIWPCRVIAGSMLLCTMYMYTSYNMYMYM